MHRSYPTLTKLWAQNAIRTRWGKPLLPAPHVRKGVIGNACRDCRAWIPLGQAHVCQPPEAA